MNETTPLLLRGLELRYVLDILLVEADDDLTVADLVDGLRRDGFQVRGRPGKTVSDTLRWDIRRGRVRRVAVNRYAPGAIPSTTLWRMRHRVRALREEARGSAAADASQRARGRVA